MVSTLNRKPAARAAMEASPAGYVLEEQLGFILRQATQRHLLIFARLMPFGLTPTQFSVINMLDRLGRCSQNQLGRLVAMDAATTKGVIDRLNAKGITSTAPDPSDARQLLVSLTAKGASLAADAVPAAEAITNETLAPLTPTERARLLALLKKIT